MRVNRLLLTESLRALGPAGVIGIGLAIFALVFALFALWPARARLQEARLDALGAQARASRPQQAKPVDNSPAAQLTAFHKAFPARPEAPDWLDKIYAVAEQEGLQVQHGEYSLAFDSKTDLAKYRILLPLKGNYMQIRAFLGAVLQEVPYLALDDVDLKRPTVGDTQVEARVRLSLYLVQQ